MADEKTNPDPLESLSQAIKWIADQANDDTGASEELREKLEAARDQAALDLEAKRLARST